MDHSESKVEYSICGVANLVVAILGTDHDTIRAQLNLPLVRHKKCTRCGALISLVRKGICEDCLEAERWVMVSCSTCGNLFRKAVWQLIRKTARGYQHFFCSKRCQGVFAGEHYGFHAHPENCSSGYRVHKWDEDMIWERHLSTHFGATRLSRMLQIPAGTIAVVLWQRRRTEAKTC